jgi:hypothetical protein
MPRHDRLPEVSDEADVPKYVSLHKLSNGMNKLTVITRDFPSTESVAQFPTVYTSLQDDILVPPYEADIMRFMNRSKNLRRVLGLMEYTFKQSRNSGRGKPLVEALETILSVLNQLWEFYEKGRRRNRKMRVASLGRLEGPLVRPSELVGRELLGSGNVAAERAAELKKIEVIEVVEREAEGDDTPEEDTVAFWFGY